MVHSLSVVLRSTSADTEHPALSPTLVRALVVSKLSIGCVSGHLMDRLLAVFSGVARLVFSARRSEQVTPQSVRPDVPPSQRRGTVVSR